MPTIKKWVLTFALAVCALDGTLGFYNPNIGRWTTRDPIEEEDSPNLYQFVKNNPLLFIDSLGLRRWIMFYYSRLDQGEFKRAADFQAAWAGEMHSLAFQEHGMLTHGGAIL